ncbi:MAG TPA: NUDIX domain-containing protein [Labilithrix sp.]|nr:NUDIX domain-containing protein [Labilithrix sp.]
MFLRWLPKAAYGIVHEVTRHLLRRPVVGIAAVARTPDGRIVLIRRADNGMWSLPGGTLEWGETLVTGLGRELDEEAGIVEHELVRVLGAWSDPMRDPRFHAVTIGVECKVALPAKPPKNPLEIREARLFEDKELPPRLAFGMEDILAAARRADGGVFGGVLE